MGNIINHFNKVLNSLKYREVEETYDIYFSRYYGLHLANAARYFSLTPTNVTMLSVIVGVIGGGLLYFQNHLWVVIIASALITLAGLLDSADGQLARMTGKSSEFGRIMDGAADSLVFVACYVGGTAYFALGPDGNVWYILLACVSGYMHNLKNGIYDYYKNEFLYYCGEKEDARVYSPYEIKQKSKRQRAKISRLVYFLYYDYIRRQFKFNSRSMKTLTVFRGFYENPNTKVLFQELYFKNHLSALSWWAWFVGLNTFRWGIIIASLFGRFDIFLWVGLISSLGFFYILYLESQADKRILLELSKA
ncbi:MAG: CDP-alcohol phosphatidyltransferase family protein [Cytophagales bacterium]|nr:CDP-alcohol phosphatidyltransferase family protein [Cytophagales bacterium]